MVSMSLIRYLILLPLAILQVDVIADEITTAESSSGFDWSYQNQNEWCKYYSECCANRQSPIDLNKAESIKRNSGIKFVNYNKALQGTLSITNNGRTVQVAIPEFDDNTRPYIIVDEEKYETMQFHFHWGSSTGKGSEHSINERRYDVELHLVHKNVKYDTIEDAQNHHDGLAILGFMLYESLIPSFNIGLKTVFEVLPNVTEYNSSAPLKRRLRLKELTMGSNTTLVYKYHGSSSIPPCFQSVNWLIFQKPIGVLKRQVNKFFNIMDSHGNALLNNFRDTQPLNDRKVFFLY